MGPDRLNAIFAALADPTRRAILARLAEGSATVKELSAPFDISGPAISRHLRVLERAGLIRQERDAQWRPCYLEADPIRAVADWTETYRRFWNESFDRLDDYLAELQHRTPTIDQPAGGEGGRGMRARLHFVTLVVADLDRARRFYTDGLGWAAALDVQDEVVMIHVGEKLILSLWAESAACNEIGEVSRGGPLPFTLAHNVGSPEEVDAMLETARAAGANVFAGEHRDWGGYTGYFTDREGFRWEVAYNPHPIGGVTFP